MTATVVPPARTAAACAAASMPMRKAGDHRRAQPGDRVGDAPARRPPDRRRAPRPDDRDRPCTVQRPGGPLSTGPAAAGRSGAGVRIGGIGEGERVDTGIAGGASRHRAGTHAASATDRAASSESDGEPPSAAPVAATRRAGPRGPGRRRTARSRHPRTPRSAARTTPGRRRGRSRARPTRPARRPRGSGRAPLATTPRATCRPPTASPPPIGASDRRQAPSRPTPEHQPAARRAMRSHRRPIARRLVEVVRRDASSPARSAMVRATRSRRSVPRPDNPSRSASMIARAVVAASRRHVARSARGRTRAFGRSPDRLRLASPRLGDPRGDRCGRLRLDGAHEGRGRHAVHRDPQVDPVPQRARHASQVALRDAGRTGARAIGRSELAAGARVHRRDEREPRREHLRPSDPDDGDAAVLERLPERLEDVPPELGQLVAEQRPLVRRG